MAEQDDAPVLADASRKRARQGSDQVKRLRFAERLLGISRKGLFLKRRRWGLREAS